MPLEPTDKQREVLQGLVFDGPGRTVEIIAVDVFAYVRDLVLEAAERRLDELESWDTVASDRDEVIRACDLYKAMEKIRSMKGAKP